MSIFYSLLADLHQLREFMLQREWSDCMRWINKKVYYLEVSRYRDQTRSGPERGEKKKKNGSIGHAHVLWSVNITDITRAGRRCQSSQTEQQPPQVPQSQHLNEECWKQSRTNSHKHRQIQHRPLVLSNFRELKGPRWQTRSHSPVKKPLFASNCLCNILRSSTNGRFCSWTWNLLQVN